MNSALLSSKKMDWCTPQDFFDRLNEEFGFVLDAAATDKTAKCPHCGGDLENAIVFADEENKEYFVYCPICGIETAETYASKAKALKAFADGKTKPISGKEADGGE